MNQTTNAISFREYLRHILNVFAVIIMIYLMANAKSYEVTWSWSFLLPSSWLLKLNTTLSSVGTLILIVPLALLVTTYILPEIKLIKLASTLLSAGFGIYFIFQLIKNNGQIDHIKNILFKINYIPSLEAKTLLFIEEWNKLMDSKTIKMERHNFLQTYYEEHINGTFKTLISNITETRFIAELAQNEFFKANQLFDENLKPGIFTRILDFTKAYPKQVAAGVIATLFVLGAFITSNEHAWILFTDAGRGLAKLVNNQTEFFSNTLKKLHIIIFRTSMEHTVQINDLQAKLKYMYEAYVPLTVDRYTYLYEIGMLTFDQIIEKVKYGDL